MIHQSSKHDFLLHLPFLIDEYFLIIHQITPYLILGDSGTIRDGGAAGAAAQHTILRLDYPLKLTYHLFYQYYLSTHCWYNIH